LTTRLRESELSVDVLFTFSEVTEWANDTTYGLAAYVVTDNISRAIRMANNLEAGSVFVSISYARIDSTTLMTVILQVNSAQSVDINVPFGGYKQSGIGREAGEYALET
jgi:aldehyde dehydrogenase (NAD+)